MQIKTWGDALRNTITKMPSEGIDVVSWFVSIDKLFEQLNVPADLQAILIRPYLSDRAKLLMSKCDPTHSAKYESMKVVVSCALSMLKPSDRWICLCLGR